MPLFYGGLVASTIRYARELALMTAVIEGSLRVRLRTNRGRNDPSKLRILAYSSTYLPQHRGGSEVTLHRLLQELRARGHETRVLVDEASRPQVVDGIDVQLADDRTVVREHFEWSDIVVAQLKTRQRAIFLSARYSRPLAYLVQIGNSPIATLAGSPDLTVFSSRFVQEQYPGSEPSLVVHPLVPETEYLTTPGDRITLINLAEIKGGRLFFELADRQPEREFLGVAGWGKQVGGPVRPNVSFMRPASDVRSVYARTRVLLMPSSYESYGRVALEAAVSGIPTIAHPAGGLVEALGDAGLWADRDDPDAWIEQLRRLDDPEEYAAQSRRVRERFERLNPQPEIDALETALVGLSLGVPVA